MSCGKRLLTGHPQLPLVDLVDILSVDHLHRGNPIAARRAMSLINWTVIAAFIVMGTSNYANAVDYTKHLPFCKQDKAHPHPHGSLIEADSLFSLDHS